MTTVIVVFGAALRPDGTPSPALVRRVDTAVAAARDKHEKRTRRWLYRFLDHWLTTPQASLQKAA